ncbi:MAG: PEP-utilizing enzyme [bacterium]|nr:PEP-utilizing enzyme [bacterium]
MSLPDIKSEDFRRLFRLKGGINFLLSDIFGNYYKNLDCLLTCIDSVWTSYLPNRIVEKTLADGLELLSNKERFSQYRKDFDEYKRRSSKFLENILKKDQLTKEDVTKSFITISELWAFYSKTEFFYTDRAYMKLEDSPSKELVANIEEFEEVKNSGREYLNQLIFAGGYTEQLIETLARQFSILEERLKMLKMGEVLELFEDKRVDEKAINDRMEAFVQHAQGQKMFYFEGGEAKNIISRLTIDAKSDEKVVKGVVANKGHKKGKIKVIPTDYYSNFNILSKIFEEMEEGDVLVAETTSPELMPACKKAGAIITDQGGLLSHAAIVSRELNIPCIVGTGNATEIFKNGDLVEVDAENGIVTILK